MAERDMLSIFNTMDDKYKDSNALMGKDILTMTKGLSAPRKIMFGLHLDQFVQVKGCEIPLFSTGLENTVGKYSDSYLRLEDDYEIIDKVYKMEGYPESTYTLVVRNINTGEYHIFEREALENLTETYAYEYDTDLMDSLEVGDKVEADTVLYKSKSFDNYMNYRYGVNAYTMYTSDTGTTEDAFIIRKGFCKELISTECDTIRIPLNDNDILINYYGDSDTYKCFPDIGELVKDRTIAVSRRKNHETSLYDLDSKRLNELNKATDTPYHTETDAEIVDIELFCNKDEYSEDACDEQIVKYLKIQDAYTKKLYTILKDIMDSGAECSDDFKYKYKRLSDRMNPDKDWRDREKIYSNMIIEFKVKYSSYIIKGNKLVGRYGDKGVVAEVRDDEDMPIDENGKRIDIISNLYGVHGRLNPGQLYEVGINFIAENVVRKMAECKMLDECAKLYFDFLNIVNPKQCKHVYDEYVKLDEGMRKFFMQKVIEMKQIRYEIPPEWYYEVLVTYMRLVKHFDWIDRYDIYVKFKNRYIKMIKKCIVGYKYILKLKHTPKSKFSSRSTSYVNSKDLPSKSKSLKNNKSLYSKSPIRLGDMEHSVLSIAIPYKLVAKLNMEHSSSILSRRELTEKLYTGNIFGDVFMDISKTKNRNAEIMKAHLKAIGVELVFEKVKISEKPEIIYNNIVETDNMKVIHNFKGGKNPFITPIDRSESEDTIKVSPVKRLRNYR